jgi:hypothetical protein
VSLAYLSTDNEARKCGPLVEFDFLLAGVADQWEMLKLNQ